MTRSEWHEYKLLLGYVRVNSDYLNSIGKLSFDKRSNRLQALDGFCQVDLDAHAKVQDSRERFRYVNHTSLEARYEQYLEEVIGYTKGRWAYCFFYVRHGERILKAKHRGRNFTLELKVARDFVHHAKGNRVWVPVNPWGNSNDDHYLLTHWIKLNKKHNLDIYEVAGRNPAGRAFKRKFLVQLPDGVCFIGQTQKMVIASAVNHIKQQAAEQVGVTL